MNHLHPPRIRAATSADAEVLATFAARCFRDAFGADNRPDDLAMYLAAAYGGTQQAREIADPAMRTLVAEEAGTIVAFAQLKDGSAPDCVAGPLPIELMRFYVGAAWHGRGLAPSLMARVLDEARAMGAGTLWLGVWERNPRAIRFYQKSGFVDVGSHRFVVGTDPQTDRILVRSLGQPSRQRDVAARSAR